MPTGIQSAALAAFEGPLALYGESILHKPSSGAEQSLTAIPVATNVDGFPAPGVFAALQVPAAQFETSPKLGDVIAFRGVDRLIVSVSEDLGGIASIALSVQLPDVAPEEP